MPKKRKSTVSGAAPPKKRPCPGEGTAGERRAISGVQVVEDSEECFPRGGQETLSALEKRAIQQQAREDVRSGQDKGVEAVGDKEKDKLSLTKPAAVEERPAKRLSTLTPKKLAPGTLVLGAVIEILRYKVSVSLPFNMRGTVAISNVSDPITALVESEAEEESSAHSKLPSLNRLFRVGSLMPFYVVEVMGGKNITLSVNPRLINANVPPREIRPGMVLPGWVQSVEDHGYIIDFGVKNKNGFLLRKNATEFIKERNRGKPLCIGQVVVCAVCQGADARSVPVSVNPSVVAAALVPGDSLVALNALLPGMLVNATVRKAAVNGLLLGFLGGFEGVASSRHLPTPSLSTERYHTGKKMKARLLWVNSAEKAVGLTLQQKILSGSAYEFPDIAIGDTFHDSEVVDVDYHSIYLDLGGGSCGFAPLPLVNDEKHTNLGKAYHKGTRHSCRVVQFNLLDGVAIVSLQQSVLEKPYMKLSDIKIGDVIGGVVKRHGDYGMVVSITDTIRGVCPKNHISDARLKHPRKKFKEGSMVKCRVLNVTPEANKLLLTCKKSLVRSKDVPLSDYSLASPGNVHVGVISAVKRSGCVVNFYGNVNGFVSKSELSSTQIIEDPTSVFWAGQSVECKVIKCDAARRRLSLTLKVDAPLPVDISKADALTPGSLVEFEVTGIASNGLSLCSVATGELAFLPMMHLSDYPVLCPHLLNLHQVQLEEAVKQGHPYLLKNVLIVCGKLSFRPALASLKQSLFTHARESGFVPDVSSLKTGLVLTGFVKKTMSYGCFVELPCHLSGLAPSKYLTDEFVSDGTSLYSEMQSVHAKVLEVDQARGRFLLNLRPSDLRLSHYLEEGEVSARLVEKLEGYLSQRDAILEKMSNQAGSSSCDGVSDRETAMAQLFHPGGCVSARVIGVSGDLASLELPDGVAGKANTHTAQGVSLEPGSEVQCSMVDVDLEEMRLVVSLNPRLVEAALGDRGSKGASKKAKRTRKTKQAAFQLSSSVEATVEYKTPHYLICSCMTIAGARMAYGLMDTGQIGVLPPNLKYLKPGQLLTVTVQSVASTFRGSETGPAIVMVTGTPATDLRLRGRGTKSVAAVTYDVKVGDIISVIVENVKPTHLDIKYRLWKGRVHCCLAQDNMEQGARVFSKISVGDVIRARVVKLRERQITKKVSKKGATLDVLELTTKPSLLDPSVELNTNTLTRKKFSAGEEVVGYISDVSDRGLLAILSPRAMGFIPPMLVSHIPEVTSQIGHSFSEGMAVKCTIIECTKSSGKDYMYKASLIGPVKDIEVGDVIECSSVVTKKLPGLGVMVATSHGFGRLDITDISDHYVKNPFDKLKTLDGPVRCCVVAMSNGRLDLSLRASRTGSEVLPLEEGKEEEGDDPEVTSLEDLPEGMVLRGYVKAVTDVGVFVRLGRNIDGRVKISNLIDGYVKNYKSLYSVGRLVKVKVLEVNPVKKQLELSLRLSHVDPAAARRRRREVGEGGAGGGDGAGRSKRVRIMESTSDGESLDDLSSSEEEEEEDEEEEEEEEREKRLMPSLQLGVPGFRWDGTPSTEPARSDEEEEREVSEETISKKKSRRQKQASMKAEEAKLYSTERLLMDTGRPPESADDFDRLLLTHPDSSVLWVQYMAFLLHTTEVDKARAVAQRALRTMSFREEGEKLNVWVALMNLENLYGSQDSLMKVFESALQQNEPIEVFFRLGTIYEQSEKFELAEQLYQTMTKRFGTSQRVWTHFGQFLMTRGKVDSARKLLQRSLKRLTSKQQHVDVISKFSQLEFKYGEPERGRTMFENLVSSYPRRVDLWSVYIDMMLKLGNVEAVRDIFERAANLKISAKKMKFIFKRYLSFEHHYGSPAGVEAVKEKARAYVESMID